MIVPSKPAAPRGGLLGRDELRSTGFEAHELGIFLNADLGLVEEDDEGPGIPVENDVKPLIELGFVRGRFTGAGGAHNVTTRTEWNRRWRWPMLGVLEIEDEGGIRGRGRIGFGAVVSTLEIVSLAAEDEADPSRGEEEVLG